MWLAVWILLCLVSLCFSLAILFPLLPKRHWLRFYVGYINYVTLSSLSHYIILLIFLFGYPINSGPPRFAHHMACLIHKLLGIDWEVRNVKIGKEIKQAVVVLNHQSIIDILGLGVCMDIGQCIAVSKKEVFFYFPIGLSFWLSGIIYINRGNRENALRHIMKAAAGYLSSCEYAKIFIFPEGTRNKNAKTLLPFKKGAFKLAIEKQIPIIPLVFSPYYFIDGKKKLFTKGKMIFTFLDPIMTTGLDPTDIDMLVVKTKNHMEEEFQKLSREVECYKETN